MPILNTLLSDHNVELEYKDTLSQLNDVVVYYNLGDEKGKIILAKDAYNNYRQRVLIALGYSRHLLNQSSTVLEYCGRPTKESDAGMYQRAVEMLIPKDVLSEVLRQYYFIDDLAESFKVPIAFMRYAMQYYKIPYYECSMESL